MGDIYVVVEMIMLLSGHTAALARAEAAKKLVHVFGGNLELAAEIIARRERQDALRAEQPDSLERVFGDVVEAEVGDTSQQRRDIEVHLRQMDALHRANENERLRAGTTYNAARFTEAHHKYKDYCNSLLIENSLRYFGCIESMLANEGHVLALDDFDSQGNLRTATALMRAGVPPARILSPNKQPEVVRKLHEEEVCTVNKHVTRALQEDFSRKRVAVAYIDACTGNIEELKQIINASRLANRTGLDSGTFVPFVLAYTLIARNFTTGGGLTFTQRVLDLMEHATDTGFEPLVGSVVNSYAEFSDGAQRVCTVFWKKKRFL